MNDLDNNGWFEQMNNGSELIQPNNLQRELLKLPRDCRLYVLGLSGEILRLREDNERLANWIRVARSEWLATIDDPLVVNRGANGKA